MGRLLFWFGAGLIVVVAAFLVLPPYGAYCESNYSNDYYCAAYGVAVAFGSWVDLHNGAVTALATIIIGIFTATLYFISKNQLTHSHQVERAYISGGGVPASERRVISGIVGQVASGQVGGEQVYYVLTGRFELHINNHGKMPGRLMQVAIEFCDAGAIPQQPRYRPVFNPDWIGPGTQSRVYGHHEVPRDIANPVVYGRLYYRDIFSNRVHSSGFIQSLDMTHGGSALIEPPSEAYTAWD